MLRQRHMGTWASFAMQGLDSTRVLHYNIRKGGHLLGDRASKNGVEDKLIAQLKLDWQLLALSQILEGVSNYLRSFLFASTGT